METQPTFYMRLLLMREPRTVDLSCKLAARIESGFSTRRHQSR